MSDQIALSTGGSAAAREKTIGGATAKVQRITQAAADYGTVQTITQDATTPTVIAKTNDRVFLQITPRGGDLYLALADATNTNAATNVATAARWRLVKLGESWETNTYLGDVAILSVSGSQSVEIEQHV